MTMVLYISQYLKQLLNARVAIVGQISETGYKVYYIISAVKRIIAVFQFS